MMRTRASTRAVRTREQGGAERAETRRPKRRQLETTQVTDEEIEVVETQTKKTRLRQALDAVINRQQKASAFSESIDLLRKHDYLECLKLEQVHRSAVDVNDYLVLAFVAYLNSVSHSCRLPLEHALVDKLVKQPECRS